MPHGCLRVGCLQFSPVHGQVQENMARAESLLQARKADLAHLKLLVLPEMAFTGYQWRSKEHIDPVLESSKSSPTTEWCKRIARSLGCVVCCGLPRRHNLRRLNSMIVVSPRGKLVNTIDKHHLYTSDKTWAEAGECFVSLEKVPGLRLAPVGFGICMDINPREFEVPPEICEFASFHLDAGSKLIVFSSAWCRNHPDDLRASVASDEQVSAETIQSWMKRLQPLRGKDVYFVCADRVGEEDLTLLGKNTDMRTQFCGTSCVISLKDGSVLKALSAREEGILVVDIPLKNDKHKTTDAE
eukprot:TRINITY_DN85426_c0_g1_i1.p1 TRINITY_DN85426_c0_g1~~TRINITY_DN85426_c0_g1_i1.p1  ORF type:complete len:299 (+),score=47.29 TRINITY_DN85426_c0_g1_i1:68-964(+)